MSRDNSLAGKVAIVTGASSGMGQAIALRLARAGCSIVAHGRHSDQLKQTVQQLESEGANCVSVRGDVREYAQVQEVIQKVIEGFGQVDILVNNAGYGLCKTVAESSEEELTEQIEANLNSVVYGYHAVLPHMREGSTG